MKLLVTTILWEYFKMVVYVSAVWCFVLIYLTHHSVQEDEPSTKYDTDLSDIVFIILSQPNPFHAERADLAKVHLTEQIKDLPKNSKPSIYLTHERWPEKFGDWTVFPLLKEWSSDFQGKKWIFFCEDETRIDLKKLRSVLEKFNPAKDWFLGHALVDKEPTIIHHFTEPNKLTFPDFSAGVGLTIPLLNKLVKSWPHKDFRADFAIDPKHEFASYVLLHDVKLTDVKEFCTHPVTSDCVTHIMTTFPDCGGRIPNSDLFVAVKTCEQFHDDRVQVVLKTWAKEAKYIEFYSEKEDRSIPTIDLGVPNTERGHCGKTMAIMKRAVTESHIVSKKWLLIADDDTIINLHRLRKLLSCYDPDSLVALGERYGYQVAKGYGYNYITGGGGMVFSMPLVQRLVDECRCPSLDSPDDMILGLCLRRMEIPITHSPFFHQARPDDYSAGYLERQIPVSFHKHWNCNPYDVYKLLKDYDKNADETNKNKHEEL